MVEQDNTGTTFVNSDVEIPGLTGIDRTARVSSRPNGPWIHQPRHPSLLHPTGSTLDGRSTVECRLFVLDATVHAASRYATTGRLDPASLDACPHRAAVLDFVASLLDACADSLPSAVVVDIGLGSDADGGDEHWSVVEANMAWFSTSYAANPDRVLDVLLGAARIDRDEIDARKGGNTDVAAASSSTHCGEPLAGLRRQRPWHGWVRP